LPEALGGNQILIENSTSPHHAVAEHEHPAEASRTLGEERSRAHRGGIQLDAIAETLQVLIRAEAVFGERVCQAERWGAKPEPITSDVLASEKDSTQSEGATIPQAKCMTRWHNQAGACGLARLYALATV
jgi:hypothetical protein